MENLTAIIIIITTIIIIITTTTNIMWPVFKIDFYLDESTNFHICKIKGDTTTQGYSEGLHAKRGYKGTMH